MWLCGPRSSRSCSNVGVSSSPVTRSRNCPRIVGHGIELREAVDLGHDLAVLVGVFVERNDEELVAPGLCRTGPRPRPWPERGARCRSGCCSFFVQLPPTVTSDPRAQRGRSSSSKARWSKGFLFAVTDRVGHRIRRTPWRRRPRGCRWLAKPGAHPGDVEIAVAVEVPDRRIGHRMSSCRRSRRTRRCGCRSTASS